MSSPKTSRIALRTTPRQDLTMQMAAAQTDRTVSDFILTAATTEAEKVLADRRWFAVTAEQFDAVQAILDTPLENTDRFARLWNRPSPFGTEIPLEEDA